MGGALDSARFKCYLAKATGANINNVDGMVIGGHGDTTMIPLVSKATVNGVPVSQFASKKKLEEAVANTMVGGATLTKLIGTSAWYAPGAGCGDDGRGDPQRPEEDGSLLRATSTASTASRTSASAFPRSSAARASRRS